MPPPEQAADQPKVGILAGWGRYPIVVAEALRRQGCAVYCLGGEGMADPELAALCDDFQWIGLGKLGKAIRYFQRHGVQRVTMAGKLHKTLLYQPWIWFRHLPDWRTVRRFYPHFILRRGDGRDDTYLSSIIAEFALDGICFEPATNFAPELLVQSGQLSVRPASDAQAQDIEFGWRMAKELGRLDIGQSVAVKDRTILAVEAIEGTDACIRRAGELCSAGGFTLVKVAKPQQDMRFDVPTIGLQTLETLRRAGGRVLAIEAHKTIVIDEPEAIAYANQHRLAIVALENPPALEYHAPAEENQPIASRPSPSVGLPASAPQRKTA